jgi:hypothetical protein
VTVEESFQSQKMNCANVGIVNDKTSCTNVYLKLFTDNQKCFAVDNERELVARKSFLSETNTNTNKRNSSGRREVDIVRWRSNRVAGCRVLSIDRGVDER